MSSLLPGGVRFPNDPSTGKEGGYGLPSWAKRDTGPMNTYAPGPISNEPLPSSYHGGARLVVSGVIFGAVIVSVLVSSGIAGLNSVLILVGLWALYAVPVMFRRRIGFRVDGPRAEVHGLFREVAFEGADVAKVQFVFAGKSPDVRLVLRDGRKVLVVTSRLERGHSTLYEWLRRYAPDVAYDQKALDLRDMLVNRGLMGAPGDPWDAAGRFGPEEGTTSDSAPSEVVKTSSLSEAKAPDSPKTRTDDDEQA